MLMLSPDLACIRIQIVYMQMHYKLLLVNNNALNGLQLVDFRKHLFQYISKKQRVVGFYCHPEIFFMAPEILGTARVWWCNYWKQKAVFPSFCSGEHTTHQCILTLSLEYN